MSGFHALATGLDDPELSGPGFKLDLLRRFGGRSKDSNGADNKRGLGTGDGVAEKVPIEKGGKGA